MKVNLLAHFKLSQRLINNLIDQLENYTFSNQSVVYYSAGVTFESYIAYLKDLRSRELTDDLYNKLLSMNQLSKENISSMLTALDNQILSFNQSIAYFNTTFNYIPNLERE
ncbi:hypothetical protein [Rubrolithibacter danxiaensis]|uniref:hypothetical protein n=1 Tax=Rubrolithibacter danxiaensis TaxID=3390805 RepID=UPI003BF80957